MENLYSEVVQDILGYPGKMISASKSSYARAFPDHIVIFNANLFAGGKKIWFGDLDISESIDSIKELSESIGEDVYVLFEMDGRFGNEENPNLDNAVVIVKPGGEYLLHERLGKRVELGELKL